MSGTAEQTKGLRVLAADADPEALRRTGDLLTGLGHTVVGCEVGIEQAAARIAQEDPDVAIVVVAGDPGYALDLIEEITAFARGPVIALRADGDEPGFAPAAAARGVYAIARDTSPDDVQSAIDLAVHRHAELRSLTDQIGQLEGAMERRGVIERAKGILMERHGITEHEAFALIRDRARSSNRRVVDLAQAVTEGHALLPRNSKDRGEAAD